MTFAVATILVPLAFIPAVAFVFVSMPEAIIGASVLFTSTFVVTSGVETMASRMLDARRIMVIGAAVIAAQVAEKFPTLVAHAPDWIHPFLATPLVTGVLVALLLNLLFRIGIHRRGTFEVKPGAVDSSAIQQFMERCGATWGARPDVIRRAAFALAELVEMLGGELGVQEPIFVEARFDEFHVDLRAIYRGALPPLPAQRPSVDEIAESPDGGSRLAGFMIRRLADHTRANRRGLQSIVDLRFDH